LYYIVDRKKHYIYARVLIISIYSRDVIISILGRTRYARASRSFLFFPLLHTTTQYALHSAATITTLPTPYARSVFNENRKRNRKNKRRGISNTKFVVFRRRYFTSDAPRTLEYSVNVRTSRRQLPRYLQGYSRGQWSARVRKHHGWPISRAHSPRTRHNYADQLGTAR